MQAIDHAPVIVLLGPLLHDRMSSTPIAPVLGGLAGPWVSLPILKRLQST